MTTSRTPRTSWALKICKALASFGSTIFLNNKFIDAFFISPPRASAASNDLRIVAPREVKQQERKEYGSRRFSSFETSADEMRSIIRNSRGSSSRTIVTTSYETTTDTMRRIIRNSHGSTSRALVARRNVSEEMIPELDFSSFLVTLQQSPLLPLVVFDHTSFALSSAHTFDIWQDEQTNNAFHYALLSDLDRDHAMEVLNHAVHLMSNHNMDFLNFDNHGIIFPPVAAQEQSFFYSAPIRQIAPPPTDDEVLKNCAAPAA